MNVALKSIMARRRGTGPRHTMPAWNRPAFGRRRRLSLVVIMLLELSAVRALPATADPLGRVSEYSASLPVSSASTRSRSQARSADTRSDRATTACSRSPTTDERAGNQHKTTLQITR